MKLKTSPLKLNQVRNVWTNDLQ